MRRWVEHCRSRRRDAETDTRDTPSVAMSSELLGPTESSNTYDVYETELESIEEIRASKSNLGWYSRLCMETPALRQRAADALREFLPLPLEMNTKEENLLGELE